MNRFLDFLWRHVPLNLSMQNFWLSIGSSIQENYFIVSFIMSKAIHISFVTFASSCDVVMAEWTLVKFEISPCDGEIVEWTLVMFAISACDGEMVE